PAASPGEDGRRGDRARRRRHLAVRAGPASGAPAARRLRAGWFCLGGCRPARGAAEIAMRYTAILGGEERLIEVTPRENGYRVVIGGRELDLDAVHLQGFAVSLIAGTRSYRCDIDPGRNGQVGVLVGETVYPLEILDERRLRMRRAGGTFTLEGPQRIDAPMPGKVTRVL